MTAAVPGAALGTVKSQVFHANSVDQVSGESVDIVL